ncbi:MAG: ABC transporter permease [Oscillospiraceae bacterium]|nr:ABC transporter permease [Oscillospiraceae bacterium]
MLKYIIKRILAALVTLTIIVSVVFILVRQMPIEGYFDNFEKLDQSVINAKLVQMGLTRPIHIQLINFFGKLFRGDLGTSARYSVGVSIGQLIAAKAPVSILFGLVSMVLSMLLGIPLGLEMARSQTKLSTAFATKFFDWFGTIFIVFVNAVPSAVYHIFIQEYGSRALNTSMLFSRGNWVTWVLPVVSMSLGGVAYYAMWLRRYMVDELNRDYVSLARAKGVTSKNIMKSHVFRNAFVPMIQYIPGAILFTVVGSIYVESLYSIPGMGGLLVDVIKKQDNPMVQILVMIYSCIGVVGLLLGDLMMAVIDPRITFVKKEGAR